MELKDICQYVPNKISTSALSLENYVSTENMLADKGGVVKASGIPSGNAVSYTKDDVLISNIRPYFKKIWQADKDGGCSADVLCLRANEGIDRKYFYYLLSQQSFFDYMMSGSKGCKMPRGDKKQIMQWHVSLPSIQEQRRIAAVLSSLDVKIELNRRINDNLEQQAQALFRSWFVDFEPFGGVMPKDWKMGKLSDIIDILSGFAFKSNTFESDGKYKLVTIKAVQDGHLELNGADHINVVPTNTPSHCFLKTKDILLSLTGNVGRCCLVTANNLLLNQRVASVRSKNPSDWAYTYMLFRLAETKTYLESISRGTAQANLSPIETANMPIAIAPRGIMDAYAEFAGQLLNQSVNLTKETFYLSSLRDTLLPRLMSGELKVNEINA